MTGEDFPPKERNDTTTTWRGTKVRFRIIGGAFTIRVQGRGINLSLVGKGTVKRTAVTRPATAYTTRCGRKVRVGKGTVKLNGAGTGDDGTFSVNGGDYTAIPDSPLTFPLAAPTQ